MCCSYHSDTARLLVHRVIKINHHRGTASYLIKGDAGTSPDGWFQPENILGRVEVKERAGLRIILTSFIQRWKAQVWVILAPWVILVFMVAREPPPACQGLVIGESR